LLEVNLVSVGHRLDLLLVRRPVHICTAVLVHEAHTTAVDEIHPYGTDLLVAGFLVDDVSVGEDVVL